MEDFKFEWERFLNGFDSLEETGKWDVDKHGEMETFCENILVCILVKAVFADREATQAEVDAINDMFGFELNLNIVSQILGIMDSEKNDILDDPKATFDLIKTANEKIYNEFKELVCAACQIVMESDGIATSIEAEKLNTFIKKI